MNLDVQIFIIFVVGIFIGFIMDFLFLGVGDSIIYWLPILFLKNKTLKTIQDISYKIHISTVCKKCGKSIILGGTEESPTFLSDIIFKNIENGPTYSAQSFECPYCKEVHYFQLCPIEFNNETGENEVIILDNEDAIQRLLKKQQLNDK